MEQFEELLWFFFGHYYLWRIIEAIGFGFLIIAGILIWKYNPEFKYESLLIIVGIHEIFSFIFGYDIFILIFRILKSSSLPDITQFIISSILVSILSIGAIFLILGVKNLNNRGIYLIIAGIIWYIGRSIEIIWTLNFINSSSRLGFINSTYSVLTWSIIRLIWTLSYFFFLIFSMTYKKNLLPLASIILMIAQFQEFLVQILIL